MRLYSSVTVLSCADMEQSLDFYRQALQFVILKKRNGPEGLEWAYLQSGDTLLMLEKSSKPPVNTHCNNRIYFFVDDVDGMHHLLKAKGFSISTIISTPYMKEFDLYDPDGQRLTLGQPLAEKAGNRNWNA
jgi:catechol 2,3-dioxygenase-like lactoylglutathione lyase family enzyme